MLQVCYPFSEKIKRDVDERWVGGRGGVNWQIQICILTDRDTHIVFNFYFPIPAFANHERKVMCGVASYLVMPQMLHSTSNDCQPQTKDRCWTAVPRKKSTGTWHTVQGEFSTEPSTWNLSRGIATCHWKWIHTSIGDWHSSTLMMCRSFAPEVGADVFLILFSDSKVCHICTPKIRWRDWHTC